VNEPTFQDSIILPCGVSKLSMSNNPGSNLYKAIKLLWYLVI
jgi:hypothetical protein